MERIRSYGPVVVALSGGVDSSVVAAAAVRASSRPADCVAVTAWSPSVASWQLDLAKQVATEIGIAHEIIRTDEGSLPDYQRNDRRRCFHCKQTLYRELTVVAERFGDATVLSGTNADDLGDYRPGIEAGELASVQTPLADLGINKQQVREIAEYFGLSNHALPASPCLASRIAYGVEVTPQRLAKIEKAEDWLRGEGFSDCRVRLHEGELARVEVPSGEIDRLTGAETAARCCDELVRLGFKYVTIDLQGLRSGSMNQLLVTIEDASVAGRVKQ